MNPHDPTLAKSGGREPDLLEIKPTGTLGGEYVLDLNRGQEVELVVRGVVVGHAFDDKEKDGTTLTTKAAKVKLDHLLRLEVIGWRGRGGAAAAAGQTSIYDGVSSVAVDDDDAGEIVDADVVLQLERGDVPHGVDPETGEIEPMPDDEDVVDSDETFGPPRHPRVPEDAWSELNHAQRRDVLERVVKVEGYAEYLAGVENPTDKQQAEKKLGESVALLEEDYGIVLLDPEDVVEADDGFSGAPPAPVTEKSGKGMAVADLERRRAYLMAKRGLPKEALDARDEEVSLIDHLLATAAKKGGEGA